MYVIVFTSDTLIDKMIIFTTQICRNIAKWLDIIILCFSTISYS